MVTLSGKWAGAIAFVAGAATWVAVARIGGRAEAWDTPLYTTVLLPALAAVVAALGFFARRKAWLWGVLASAGQAAAMFARKPTGSMLPAGLLLLAVLGVMMAIPALFGAAVRVAIERRHHSKT